MNLPTTPIRLSSFSEFEEAIAKLQRDLKAIKPVGLVQSELLFRGQANSEWRLETTLERFNSSRVITVNRYNSYLARAKPAVETLTGKMWPFQGTLQTPENEEIPWGPPNPEFMMYARHHGYPSPLLDWTRSPYIALYFAFCNSSPNRDVAVFAYVSSPQGVKWRGTMTDERLMSPPAISELSPFATTHPRHFSQQSRYTVCTKIHKTSNREYCSHELAMNNTREDQVLLQKYILPSSLRHESLDRLDHMNINGFTLFNSEDGLMAALAFREIEVFEANRSDN